MQSQPSHNPANIQSEPGLQSTLGGTHEIIDITLEQMGKLCGNSLELLDGRGVPIMAMSSQAFNGFSNDQRKVILKHCAAIMHSPIDTIESIGGGSVRCALAELF
jgi:hypothetical protein